MAALASKPDSVVVVKLDGTKRGSYFKKINKFT